MILFGKKCVAACLILAVALMGLYAQNDMENDTTDAASENARAIQPVFEVPEVAIEGQGDIMGEVKAYKRAKIRREGGAKNVILFIGDGMGVSTVTAARIFEGQQRGESGEENKLSFEKLPHLSLSKVYNTNQQTPDSAGTMTAMMTGLKTKAGVLAVDSTTIRGDYRSARMGEIFTLLEISEMIGKSTGVVSTARLTHATPAACYAHSPERNWEADSNLPEEARQAGYPDIASQLIDFPYGNGLEVAMGGGRRNFMPNTSEDPEDAGNMGRRTDGRDLTAEWTQQYQRSAYVWNREGFDAVNPATTDHLLGLFERSHMEYEHDRPNDAGGEPSISEMTGKAIDILRKNPNGFFLMVEAGRIDHAHHAGNAYRAMTDTVAFSDAVQTALDKVSLEDTLVIVTADHSHVFTIAGYPTRGNNILGKVIGNDSRGMASDAFAKDSTGYPYTAVGYHNGPGYRAEGLEDLSDVDTLNPDFRQVAAVPMGSETHSAEDVAIFAGGPGAEYFQGTVEQNFIFRVMKNAFLRFR